MPPSESNGAIPPWIYEYATSRSFQDAVRKVVDAKWLADNVPVTGAKAEVTGVKAEANAVALSAFGVQTEYGLVKHEATVFDINKILEGRVQESRDKEQDRRLHVLSVEAVSIKDLVQKVKQDLMRDTGRTFRSLGTRVEQTQNRITPLQNAVGGIRRKLIADDQRLRNELSRLNARVVRIGQVANAADERSKSARTKTQEAQKQLRDLDREVKRGLRQVRELDESAKRTRGSVYRLRNDLDSLDQTLRR